MVQGLWQELWPLIVLVHAPELLCAVAGIAVALGLLYWVGKRVKGKG